MRTLHIFILPIFVSALLLPSFIKTAQAGAVQRGYIEKGLRKSGVGEKNAKIIARATDAVLSSALKLLNKASIGVRSNPSVRGPIVSFLANSDKIACATISIMIRDTQQAIVNRQSKVSSTQASAEAALLVKLSHLQALVSQKCRPDPKVEDTVKKPPRRHSTGAIVDHPLIPDGWTKKDIACAMRCRREHEHYTRRAKILRPIKKALDTALKIHKRISSSEYKKYKGKIVLCKAFYAPMKKAWKKYLKILEENTETIKVLDIFYDRTVVSCIRKCPKPVQAYIRPELNKTKLHISLVGRVTKPFFNPYTCPKSGDGRMQVQ